MSKATQARGAGFEFRFHPRILGTPAPVFPGFEVDISTPAPASEKQDALWHRRRAKAIATQNREIRHLIGNNPWTALWCIALAAAQTWLALWVAGQPLWLVAAVAYLAGGLLNMNLFTLAHECNHNLVFRHERPNRWLFTLTSLPMFMPGHHTWWIEHHVHHNDLGAKKDFVKRRRSFFLLTRTRSIFGMHSGPVYRVLSWLSTPLFCPYALLMLIAQVGRAALGLLVYLWDVIRTRQFKPSDRALAILADQHLVSGYHRYRLESWAALYPLLGLGYATLLFALGGWGSILYLLLSALFFTGFLHPFLLGLILANSHFHGHRYHQPSSSYYAWPNLLTFNLGYHTEHHDFCRIPWNRLPKLRKIAPEYYDSLLTIRSYCALAFLFVFGSERDFEEKFDAEIYRNLKSIGRNPEQEEIGVQAQAS